ncbi:AI-2E family transporter [Neorhizobium sp. LjRoot104]|uniref:AI-2E family transporter n=1 Tax=Neorhizobium sp. LjRoot104 TaxID=3342254 RepID=UPI003ECCC033
METRLGDARNKEDSERSVRTRASQWAVTGLFIYASILCLSLGKDFFVPIVLAFLLALVFSPIRRFFDGFGIPPALTSILIVSILVMGLVAIVGAIIVPVSGYLESLPRIEEDLQLKLAGLSEALSGAFEASRRLADLVKNHAANVQQVELRGNGPLTSAALIVPAMLAQTLLTLILLLFLLASGDLFYEKLVEAMPTVQDKRRAMQIANDIERNLSRYLLTITAINASLAVVMATLLWLIGMPNAVLFGVIAFVCNFVPYLGPLASLLAGTAVALISFDGVGFAAIVAMTYLVVMTFEGQIVTPYFIGRRLRLNTVVVLIAVSFWAWLWSIIGMLLAVPLLVTLNVFCNHVPRFRGLGNFLSSRADVVSETEDASANGSGSHIERIS